MELLPCPFCGSCPVIPEDINTIFCKVCYIYVYQKIWNTRASQWISIDEKLPDVNQDVLYVATNEIGSRQIMKGHRNENNIWHSCHLFYVSVALSDIVKITHWQPLPELPNG